MNAKTYSKQLLNDFDIDSAIQCLNHQIELLKRLRATTLIMKEYRFLFETKYIIKKQLENDTKRN